MMKKITENPQCGAFAGYPPSEAGYCCGEFSPKSDFCMHRSSDWGYSFTDSG
jgi:hypothetical protein